MLRAWERSGWNARPAAVAAPGEGPEEPALEVIAIRRGSEKTKLLVGLHREACPHCHTGTRTVSTWCTLKGLTERICWCQHCFNATCGLARLSEEEGRFFERACAAIEGRARIRYT